MKVIFWLAVFGFILTAAGIVWYSLRKWQARQRAEEARFASFVTETTGKPKPAESLSLPAPAAAPATGDGLALQKLLFEAAHKAADAGEPVLAIQLYARLLARYPASSFAGQARAAVEALKKRLGKA